MNITAIILTFNEEIHLERCINNVKKITQNIIVVDSFSTDNTINIAVAMGIKVIQNKWVNYATQFNWALTQLDLNTEWVLRIDADEYLTQELVNEIKDKLPSIGSEFNAISWGRRINFQGRLICHGGVFPIQVVRLFRYGSGYCENRWMDEHIKVSGLIVNFDGEMIDYNLNSISWWISKHNSYSSREAIDLLNIEYRFMKRDTIASFSYKNQANMKRWIKEVLYIRLPKGFRAFIYFIYRYIIRIGFMDGYLGSQFHFFQGFWYRYLVDAKVFEVKKYMVDNKSSINASIKKYSQLMFRFNYHYSNHDDKFLIGL